MTYTSVQELAMVLPLPVPPSCREDAVRFINLETYPTFFEDMQRGFPTRSVFAAGAVMLSAPALKVHDVGKYAASFVPALDDFSRLDPRFQIPRHVWDKLPAYHDFGFVVFKLKPASDPQEVHPMAFEFPRRNDLLYFPTLHIHDGDIHQDAMFDHTLYCQPEQGIEEYVVDWNRSAFMAQTFMDVGAAQGIIAPESHVWRTGLRGTYQNADTLVGRQGNIPVAIRKTSVNRLI